jgi:uroporphyrinogen decarboxylase
MNSRERVKRALRFDYPDRVPRELWYLPGVEMFQREELDRLLAHYPNDIVRAPSPYGRSRRASGVPNVAGSYTDEWGCVWTVAEPGVVGEVKHPPLADWSALDSYQAPYEILNQADAEKVNAFCSTSEQFVLASTGVRPFERMQFLRGTEALFMNLAYGADEVLRLRDLVHNFFLEELAFWCQTDVDGISFMDDWGAQTRLLISPQLWRELFKPLYIEYCLMIHDAGKWVFMHSDGHISAIYADLVEIGVDALNSQLFCMDIEALGQEYRGKLTFWGEIDRQSILAFGSPQDVRAAVRRVSVALGDPAGGVIAQCEWGLNVPYANVEAVFQTWMEMGT